MPDRPQEPFKKYEDRIFGFKQKMLEKAIRQLSEAFSLIVVSPQIHPAAVLAFWYALATKASTDDA